jgi:hypothetical protein
MKKMIFRVMFLGAILVMTDTALAKICPNPEAEPPGGFLNNWQKKQNSDRPRVEKTTHSTGVQKP